MNISLKEVIQHINDYLKEHLPKYTVFEIRRQSYAPDDDYLYMVAAKHQNGTYAVWTSWNESTKSLNHGHYDLPDMKSCLEIMSDYQNIYSTYDTESTPLECLMELLIKHDDNFEDSYQQIVYTTGFVDGIAAQQKNKWKQLSETETDKLYHEALDK